jgi:hypothetical protein
MYGPVLFQWQGHFHADVIAFDSFVPAFDLAVRLRVIGRSFDMGHTGDANDFLEVLGDELGAVVADDACSDSRVTLTGTLDDSLDVGFFHLLADFEVDDETASRRGSDDSDGTHSSEFPLGLN